MQTSYRNAPAAGFPGMKADSRFSEVISGVAGADIIPGRVVVLTSGTENTMRLPTTGDVSASFFGVALSPTTVEQVFGSNTGDIAIKQYNDVPTLRKGSAFVYNEEAMAMGDSVFVRIIDGGAGKAVGQVRNDADGTTPATCVAWTAARVVSPSATAGEGVVIEFNLP